MLSATNWIAIYGAVVSTGLLFFQIFRERRATRAQRQERRKVHVCFGPRIIKHVKDFGRMDIFPICVSNLGREMIIICNVEVRHHNSKFYPGAYNEPEAMLGIYSNRVLPKRLEPGETLKLEQLTIAVFHQPPQSIIVVDAESNEYPVSEEDLRLAINEAERAQKEIEQTKQANESNR